MTAGATGTSVVIASFDAGAALGRLLTGLALDRGSAGPLEVVVVDDGSTDGTRELVAGFAATLNPTYLFLPRTTSSGRAAARNAGIKAASGDLVVMLDADQVVAPGLVAEHVRYHRHRADLVVVGPRHDLAYGPINVASLAAGHLDDALPPIARRDGRESLLAEFSENFNGLATCWHHMFSCNVSVRREHLLAVGGFDEAFRGWGLEDSELGYRLRRAGLAFAYNPGAVAYQHLRHVTPALFEEWRRNLEHFVSRHGGAADVAAQAVLGHAFDPADRGLNWWEGVRRFELAARALAGRLPTPRTYTWLEASEASAAGVLAALPRRAATEDLVVVDTTAAAALAAPVQCLDTGREVLYAHRPDAAARAHLARIAPTA